MNQTELNATRQALQAMLQRLERIQVCCQSCLLYECTQCMKHGAQPPPEWVRGPIQCEHWSYDNVPF